MSGGFYNVLGVSRTASRETIKLAYLRLAKELHPDVNKSPSAPRNFQRVREAYEVLSDARQRRDHDSELGIRDTAGRAGPASSSASSSAGASAGASARSPFGQSSYAQWSARGQTHGARWGPGARQAQWQAEEDYSRVHERYREAFDQERYKNSLTMTFFRCMPLLAPIWGILLVFSLRQKQPQQGAGSMTFDRAGRAYYSDAYGNAVRLKDFDRQ
mmetsp:Transcript_51604/g.145442  ORF Transcript_51604/g.145442 Transcript_51604/m.145442 type:complete len:216 (-) Transcript_51604:26-673(-)